MRPRRPLRGWILYPFLFFILCVSAFGEDPYRGYRRTETEHFVFIYEEKDAESVRELLSSWSSGRNTVHASGFGVLRARYGRVFGAPRAMGPGVLALLGLPGPVWEVEDHPGTRTRQQKCVSV